MEDDDQDHNRTKTKTSSGDDEKSDDLDTAMLAAVANSGPKKQRNAAKIYSYSQQLRAPPRSQRRHHQQHSLDEGRIDRFFNPNDDLNNSCSSSDDDLYPNNSLIGTGTVAGTSFSSSASSGVAESLSQKLEQVVVTDVDVAAEVRNSMPEFIGSGGGAGVFKTPTRAAVHPARPPCLELRPHPLKETQVNKCLRTIACTETQLWAGQENGVRFWKFEDSFEQGGGLGGRVRRGDEDAAPFQESGNTSPTYCLIVDNGNRLVWTGHKDGKIRSWKMDHQSNLDDDNNHNNNNNNDDSPFKEGLSWQAHRGPVLSMVITSYGDIWSGSESGAIKIWPWETIQKSLSLSPEERHMAALLVERSYIDLKTQVTINGVCSISSQDVKCLVADNVKAKVWCANPLSFSLWDARTKELSKVFNIEGQLENRVDMSQMQDESKGAVEDEMKVKFVSMSKKEKPHGFLQRSRNAIMGAADAVRRVATKGAGAFVEDHKRTEALLVTVDGNIWSGCTNGLLIQWDGNGNRLQDFTYHPCAILCFCTFGTRIYVGYVSGMVQVLDLDGNMVAGWVAHTSPVIKLAVGNGYIYSLATHGGIRGWNISSPGPLDNILRSDLAEKEILYTRRDNIKILAGTWNVGQGKAYPESIQSWLGSVSSDVGIIVVGLQEVEMGAGFLAMSAAKETIGIEGSPGGQLWLDTIGKALDEGTTFERMGSRQLAGLLISLWVRKSIRTHVGDIDAGAVACGFGRAIGNKGAVGLRMRVYDRIMCFVNCHFAAHLEAVNRRNADFDHVFRTLAFTRSSNALNNSSAGVSSAAQVLRGTNAMGVNLEDSRPELAEADMVVFLGDFNYRLHSISYDEARDFVSQRCFDWLREKDQLRAEMKAGKVFQGMREALIRFPPTYKFERRQAGLAGYDSGEKKRIPAWCDRILYRDTRSSMDSACSLECPVVSSILQYEACMDVTDSDHKPVRCKFFVQISHVDRSIRRQGFGDIVRSNEKVRAFLDELCFVPDTNVSTNSITLQNQDTSILRITNTCSKDKAIFQIICEGQATLKADGEASEYHLRGSFGFPRWLEITPAAGIIDPNQSLEVLVHHEEHHTLEEFVDGIPQNWWCEDTRDKEVILLVNVQGSCSTEPRSHRIKVRHCYSGKTVPLRVDSKSGSNSKKGHSGGSIHHRSEHRQQSSSSSDVSDDLRHFHTP